MQLLMMRVWGVAALAVACAGMANAAPKAQRTKKEFALRLAPNSGYSTSERGSKPISQSPVPNFGEVAPGCIYRSGQPSEENFAWLKAQGFRSVVCLRKERDDGAERMRKYGFNYLYLPIPDERAPTNEQAETFLKFASNRDNWPLLVHCHGGEGRAATMAALVRYSFDGWVMSLALKEARQYRFMAWARGQLCAPQRRFLTEWARTHAPGQLRPQSQTAATE
jgi:atypical dual specificity phosphatase